MTGAGIFAGRGRTTAATGSAGFMTWDMPRRYGWPEPGRYRVNYRRNAPFSRPGQPSPVNASGDLPSRSGAEPVLGHPRRDLGTRMHLQLAPDVLHVRFGRPRRDRQAPGDGVIGQPRRDQFGHLELPVGEPRPRARGPAQETQRRFQDRWPVTVVEQVAGTRQRDQRRLRDQRGDLTPQLEPGAPVPLAVQDRGTGPDRRK